MHTGPCLINRFQPTESCTYRYALTIAAMLGSAGLTGCGARLLHKDLTDDPHVLRRSWTRATQPPFSERQIGVRGTEFSNTVVLENLLIFGSRTFGITAIYPKINEVRWSRPIPNGVVSEITVGEQSVFFIGGDGFVTSVNVDTGEIQWRYEIRCNVGSKPVLHAGVVYVTAANDVVWALNAKTGAWIWHYKRSSGSLPTIYGASSPLVDNDELLVGLSDGYLVCLSRAEGHLRWERKLHTGGKFTDVDAHPVLEGSTLYLPSYDGALYALKRENGEVIWRFDAGGSKTVLIDADRLYLPASEGMVYALDKSSGKIQWKFQLDHGTPTQIALVGNYAVFGSSFQYLYALERDSGRPVYRFNVGSGSGFYGVPHYDGSTQSLTILSNGGHLYRFLRGRSHRMRDHGSTTPESFGGDHDHPKKLFQLPEVVPLKV